MGATVESGALGRFSCFRNLSAEEVKAASGQTKPVRRSVAGQALTIRGRRRCAAPAVSVWEEG